MLGCYKDSQWSLWTFISVSDSVMHRKLMLDR